MANENNLRTLSIYVDNKLVYKGTGNVRIDGEVECITTEIYPVHIHGNVSNVDTVSGNVNAKYISQVTTVSGNISTSIIHGNATTVSGNIRAKVKGIKRIFGKVQKNDDFNSI